MPFPPKQVPSFREVNPRGTVPWVTVGDLSMNESTAMSHYIVSRVKGSPLALDSTDPDYCTWLNWITFGEASHNYPLSLVLHYSDYYARIVSGSPVLPEVQDFYRSSFMEAIELVDKVLEGHGYLVADRFTIADISVGYNFVLAEMLGLFNQLPSGVIEYAKRLQARPAFEKTVELGVISSDRAS